MPVLQLDVDPGGRLEGRVEDGGGHRNFGVLGDALLPWAMISEHFLHVEWVG